MFVCERACPRVSKLRGSPELKASISDLQSWLWTSEKRNHLQTQTLAYGTHPKTQKVSGVAQRNAFKVNDPTKLTAHDKLNLLKPQIMLYRLCRAFSEPHC